MMRRSNFGDEPFDFRSMFERMNRQFEEMNRQFARFSETPALESGDWNSLPAAMHQGWSGMQIDVAEYDDEIVVTADLPGFEREEIDLSIAGNALTIRAEGGVESDHESDHYVRRERRHRAVRRTISLPVEVIESEASASYTNGVLTVTLPRETVEGDDDSHHIDVE
ncbi:Hsp20/alpha crystallin family protein [Salinigranum sp. GCM10025319]|uniref:Hsp20/alpha crystallin family protein n=1 Tax=Salinigranum sp. GCM10025319 TaxID=3252687 RepID=UPI003609080D